MADVFLRDNRTLFAVTLFLPACATGIGVVFSHGWGGGTSWDLAGGDHRLQTIDQPARFERIWHTISAS